MKFPFSRYIVSGISMFPTLKSGQQVLTFNWIKPQIGDIVIVQSEKCKVKSEIIKRIQKIQDNKVYLVGDNEEESTDSRSFGWVQRSEIVGKVIYVR